MGGGLLTRRRRPGQLLRPHPQRKTPPAAGEPPRELMNGSLPSAVEQRWQEVLRRAAIALKGAGVGVWEADRGGRLHLLATSDAEGFAPVVADDLEVTLRALGVLPPRGAPRRWVASRLKGRRWCIAPVRRDPPPPPSAGVERRGRERVTLELAGVCIGLIDDADGESPAGLAFILDQVPAIPWPTDGEVRVVPPAGAGLQAQQNLS